MKRYKKDCNFVKDGYNGIVADNTPDSIAFAIDGGADTFVSSDMKHHHIATLLNAGLNIVELTHYSAEIYGLARIYDQTNAKLGVVSHFFTEECML